MTTVRTALKIITVQPKERKHYFIQWEVDTTQLGTGPFTFFLYRSGTPEGDWELIANTLVDVYTYEDQVDLLHGMDKDLFYKVEVTIGSELYGSFPRNVRNNLPRKKELLIRKIVNDERKLLKAGMGTNMAIIKRKHWGTRCTRCYDTRSGEVVMSKCPNCFGTTFEGGYFPPIYIMGHLKPVATGTDLTAQTSTPEVETSSGFIQNYPIVSRGDFLVEIDTNKRWEITASQPTEILRNVVHQDLTLSHLSTAHPVYQVEVA